MTDYNRVDAGNLDAIKSDGTVISANRNGASSTFGCTLVTGVTYYFPLGSARAPVPAETTLASAHLRWDASVIVTFTIETSNFPRHVGDYPGGTGPTDVSDFDTTAGNWMQENPTTAYISGSGSGGLTVTNSTMVVAGGIASGTTVHLGNVGTRRVRIKAVVGGTGGLVRCAVHGKAGA